jgi:antitoxin component of MazEF toxin-antitoxin module
MRTSIITIGNSKGIRIPKPLLKESGIEHDVEITVKPGEIKVVPVKENGRVNELTLASEAALAKNWMRPEEEEAWKAYQLDK